MKHWTLEDISWDRFDASKVNPSLVPIVKAAALVEYNGYDYARYLSNVFADDPVFKEAVQQWAEEEVQHGAALRRWAELADPVFDFGKSFKRFTDGYKLPLDTQASVRGSRCGELIARCVVETGTSSYYTAIGEVAEEPVLTMICAKIAADEYRHYHLFYKHLKRYLEKDNIGFLRRLKIAMGRVAESEDDELAYAYYAANTEEGTPYRRKQYTARYMKAASSLYRRHHIERMTAMVFKAVGLPPQGRLNRIVTPIAWNALRLKERRARMAA